MTMRRRRRERMSSRAGCRPSLRVPSAPRRSMDQAPIQPQRPSGPTLLLTIDSSPTSPGAHASQEWVARKKGFVGAPETSILRLFTETIARRPGETHAAALNRMILEFAPPGSNIVVHVYITAHSLDLGRLISCGTGTETPSLISITGPCCRT